jgi:hypothetical protein
MSENLKIEAAQRNVDKVRKQVYNKQATERDLAAAERIRDFFLKKS